VARAAAAGVTRVVAVGEGASGNAAVLALASRHPEVRPAFGLHPERLDTPDAELEAVEAQVVAHRERLVAIGEIGLPWYGLRGRGDAAALAARGRARLARLLGLARRLALPVSLHAPHGAAAEALDLLGQVEVPAAIFHWHKADPVTTGRIVAAGHRLGITPEVVDRERARALVREVGLAPLVLESDGPWRYRSPASPAGSETGEPAMCARSAAAISEILGCRLDEVLARLADNVRRCLPTV
jgi:TatD DNase family protein